LTTFFIDTSAVAKRYLLEAGSTWVRSWIEPGAGHVIVIADLTPVEMFSVLARKRRENTLSASDLTIAQTDFLGHVEREYLSVSLDAPLLTQARILVNLYPLRALDATQLAAALRFTTMLGEPITFVSADNNLLAAAAAEGFATDNPLLHP